MAVAISGESCAAFLHDLRVIERPEVHEDEENREEESGVSDPVDYEGFCGGFGSRDFLS